MKIIRRFEPRSVAVAALASAGAVFMMMRFGRNVPVHEWFFFELASIWAWNACFVATCTSVGACLVDRLVPAHERTGLETLALSFSAGVVVFALCMYAGGLAHLYGHVFAVALPAILLAATARRALSVWQHIRDTAPPRQPPGALAVALGVGGVLLVGVLVLGAMSPYAINYDARWVHMVIAQDYARAGQLVSFPGDQVKNVPHLGAMLTTWSFLVPGLHLPALRWMMAMHTEIAVFLMTLVGIAALARWFSERDAPAAWTALMLFPGIFVYDSNLGGASDHFLASFAAPLFIVLAKAVRRFDPKTAILVGLLAGGALMTKVQALYLLTPLTAWALWRGVALGRRRHQPSELGDERPPDARVVVRAVAIAVGVALGVLAPYLLCNVAYYRNPVYPMLQNVFTHSTPTMSDAATQMSVILPDWRYLPPAAWGQRLKKAFELTITFSFVPHYTFVSNLPMFGSLFTLGLPLLLFLRRPGRLALGALIVLGAVLSWSMSYWVDRNLQTFLPVMVAVTAGILIRAWELGALARVGVTFLVFTQVAWAGPLYFSGSDRIVDAVDLLKSGMEGRAHAKLRDYRRAEVELGESLPADAVVVTHTIHDMLGINRPVILDWAGFQALIDYRPFKTARDLYDRLRQIGATHVVWMPGRVTTSKQEEVLFHVFAQLCENRHQFGGLVVAELPTTPPPAEAGYKVLAVGMPGYPDGLYAVEALGRDDDYPPALQHQGAPYKTAPEPATLLDEAKVVLVGAQAPMNDLQDKLASGFREIQATSDFRVLLRN